MYRLGNSRGNSVELEPIGKVVVSTCKYCTSTVDEFSILLEFNRVPPRITESIHTGSRPSWRWVSYRLVIRVHPEFNFFLSRAVALASERRERDPEMGELRVARL